jgi:transcriptional regulator with PAS, ATPase and Fis domain
MDTTHVEQHAAVERLRLAARPESFAHGMTSLTHVHTMNFARRLLLVVNDHRFGQLVQTHLHKTFLLTAPVVRFDDLTQLVTRDTDGLLVFLASEPDDAERIEAAVRDIRIQQFPAQIGVLCTEEFAATRRLDSYFPHLDGYWVWPGNIKELNNWIRRTLTEGRAFVDPATEPTHERIRRRLLALTPSLTHMVEQLAIASSHDVTVLIEGETGTGKTHLAKLIHDCSSRHTERFLVVACGALSGNLIASEFFGHVKGSFTGADSNKVGKFEAAGRGSLLLDEIDTLGLEHQANLLRVIETGEFEPVGSNETKHCVARIVAATNWNLSDAVERGTFRRDLYYRLHVITFHLPPLRERVQDIGPLVRGMVARYGAKFAKKIIDIAPDAMQALESFPWPGNIRQLENVIQQAVLTCTSTELGLSNLSPIVRTKPSGGSEPLAIMTPNSLAHNRETTERTVIIRALEKAAFSRTRAAQLLGVSRVTLYKKMKKYGLLSKVTPIITNETPLRSAGL